LLICYEVRTKTANSARFAENRLFARPREALKSKSNELFAGGVEKAKDVAASVVGEVAQAAARGPRCGRAEESGRGRLDRRQDRGRLRTPEGLHSVELTVQPSVISPQTNKGVFMDKDRIEGSAEQAKGKVKEVAGKVTGDNKTEAEGKADQLKGKVQNTIGGIKDTLRGK
jgi:uncharacterized protein YjbJ (UPF0337 family)